MEAKLAEYRAKKSAEQAVIERKSKIWNFFTLKFLRGDDENYATIEDALEENIEVEQTWTSIDYAILAVKFVIWLVGQIIFVKLDFGAVYFATSAFAFIWLSLGKERRQPGQMSAYSVFNPNCQNIQGSFTAEQFESESLGRKKIS